MEGGCIETIIRIDQTRNCIIRDLNNQLHTENDFSKYFFYIRGIMCDLVEIMKEHKNNNEILELAQNQFAKFEDLYSRTRSEYINTFGTPEGVSKTFVI